MHQMRGEGDVLQRKSPRPGRELVPVMNANYFTSTSGVTEKPARKAWS